MMKTIRNIIGCLLIVFIASSCDLETKVEDQLSFEDGITDMNTARQVMDGVYERMNRHRYYGRNMIINGEVRADNVYAAGRTSRYRRIGSMNVPPDNGRGNNIFKYAYSAMSGSNIVLHTDFSEIDGNDNDKNHILGEAYVTRALIHFDLLRMYGQQYINDGEGLGVSYIKEFGTDEVNSVPRSTVDENKKDIYDDIAKAIEHFDLGSGSNQTSKVRMSKDAAIALEVKVATYFREYDRILDMAGDVEQVIAKYPITPADDLYDYWDPQASPGPASIFEIQVTENERQGSNGLSYIYGETVYGDIVCYDDLLSDANFDVDNDVRAAGNMIGLAKDDDGNTLSILRNLGKYRSSGSLTGIDNIKVFRVEELILNYAEALALSNTNEVKGREYLNSIPENRGLGADFYPIADQDNILEERRKELLFEGFRFHDLARFGLGIRDIDPSTPNNHGDVAPGDSRFALPIPQDEIDSNKNSKQNPGY